MRKTIHLLKTYENPPGVKRRCCKLCMVDLSKWTWSWGTRWTRFASRATCVGKGTHMNLADMKEQAVVNGEVL